MCTKYISILGLLHTNTTKYKDSQAEIEKNTLTTGNLHRERNGIMETKE